MVNEAVQYPRSESKEGSFEPRASDLSSFHFTLSSVIFQELIVSGSSI